MPDQLLIAIALLVLLFVLEYLLSLMPRNPFKSLKINGNLLKFQRSAMSRQYSIQKSRIHKAIITPGHISLLLAADYDNRVLNLNFEKSFTEELYRFLQRSLDDTVIEYLVDSSPQPRPSKPVIGLVK